MLLCLTCDNAVSNLFLLFPIDIALLQEKGPVGDDLRRAINSQNNKEILLNWLKLAAKVSRIEEFAEKVQGTVQK